MQMHAGDSKGSNLIVKSLTSDEIWFEKYVYEWEQTLPYKSRFCKVELDSTQILRGLNLLEAIQNLLIHMLSNFHY